MKASQRGRKQESASLEDYLKAIRNLSHSVTEVGITAISEKLDIKKPSVTSAVDRLKEKGFVEHESYGPVVLTERGRKLAREVAERHEVLFKFLTEILDVDRELADEDACRMEHYVSESTLEKISIFVDFLLSCPRDRAIVLENFRQYAHTGTRTEDMKGCCGDLPENPRR